MPDSLDPQALSAPIAPNPPPVTSAVGPAAQVLLDHEAELLAQLKRLTLGLHHLTPGEVNASVRSLCDWLREQCLGLQALQPGRAAVCPVLFVAGPFDPPAQGLGRHAVAQCFG